MNLQKKKKNQIDALFSQHSRNREREIYKRA